MFWKKVKAAVSSQNTNSVILLDIDGVISPMGAVDGLVRRARQVQYSNFAVTDEVASFFANLSENNVDIVWASTWEDECCVLGEELGIADSGYLDFERVYNGYEWFKEEAIRNFIERNQNRRIVWLDDEIPDYLIQYANSNHPDIFVVRVEPMRGVDTELMLQIERFLNS